MLPVKENFLCRQVFKVSKVYPRQHYISSKIKFEQLFVIYLCVNTCFHFTPKQDIKILKRKHIKKQTLPCYFRNAIQLSRFCILSFHYHFLWNLDENTTKKICSATPALYSIIDLATPRAFGSPMIFVLPICTIKAGRGLKFAGFANLFEDFRKRN